MNVSLTRELESYVTRQVRRGAYATHSEVVRAGLRLLMERDQLLQAAKRIEPVHETPAAAPAGGSPEPAPATPASERLPQFLWQYFPEYDPAHLSPATDRGTIIGRLMENGGLDAIRWLREKVPPGELRDFIRRRQGRGLSPRSLRFWALMLGLPADEVDPWVREAASGPWAKRAG